MRLHLAATLGFGLFALPAVAQTAPPAALEAPTATDAADAPKSFWEQANLLGDFGGKRTALENAGVVFSLTDTEEGMANLAGGRHTGAIEEGLAVAGLKLDTGKLGLWDGGTLAASANFSHGRGATQTLVGNLQTVSGIEAPASAKLYDLYYEQALLGGKLSLRGGQFGADEEFIITGFGAGFVNASFGFPILPATDLPNGGPEYPLAALGARAKVNVTDQLTVLAAVFNGNPLSRGDTIANSSGTDFALNNASGSLSLLEAQYAVNQGADDTGLPGTYKIGAWYASGNFANQNQYTGRKIYSGNGSLYAVADQLIWRQGAKSADSTDPTKQRGIGVFARVMGSPDDRNQIDFAASAGAAWTGPMDGRESDVLGVGVNYAHVGNRARASDIATNAANNLTGSAAYPIRSSETVFELNYLAPVTGWMQVQPSAQYVISPNANASNPVNPTKSLSNAVVLGLRGIVTF